MIVTQILYLVLIGVSTKRWGEAYETLIINICIKCLWNILAVDTPCF